MTKSSLLLILIIIIYGCQNKKENIELVVFPQSIKNIDTIISQNDKEWIFKDIEENHTPGISLYKALERGLLKEKKSDSVIIAVIDTEIDINHEVLKGNIWKNKKEVADNGLDDDKNGYVDDINGWNFIGNSMGENIIYANDESLRIVRIYENDSNPFVSKKLYEEALKKYDEAKKSAIANMDYVNFLTDTYPKSKKALLNFFPKEDYTTNQLDSLYEIYKKKDQDLAKLIYYMSDYIKYDLSEKWIEDLRMTIEGGINKSLNPDYYDREILGDDPHDIKDTNYGNSIVNGNLKDLYHGTEVAALIAGQKNDQMASVCESCLIMPVCISSNGNENDKDIALGIKYAVDNGARIINMSFGKELSIHNQWVIDAIKYAEKNNVLIISSAGNSTFDMDEINNLYPNDNINNGHEIVSNFMKIGASTINIDKNLVARFSNYGKHDVDIFAPGNLIQTAMPFNKYRTDSGTSLSSAIVSGIAGIILSQHPNLSPAQVKKIILDSGVNYPIEVIVPGKSKDSLVFFNKLSKSGKIVNVYNALILAENF